MNIPVMEEDELLDEWFLYIESIAIAGYNQLQPIFGWPPIIELYFCVET